MTDLIINIGIFQTIGIIATICASLVSLAWAASARFTKTEILLLGLDNRLTTIEGKFSGAFKSKSPISLQPKGQEMLIKSGLKSYIDNNKDSLLRRCHEINSLKTAYDVQEATFACFDKINFDLHLETQIKNVAFSEGFTVEVLRRVGGIYFRDVCLRDLNLNVKDLDMVN